MTSWTYNDGGRAVAGFRGEAGDCVTRAIAIATGLLYRSVYDELAQRIKLYAANHRSRAARKMARGGGLRGTTPRNGVSAHAITRPYLKELGWIWQPTMTIGTGCRVHLRADELPSGRLIVKVSKHLVAVIDGVVHDTHDCTRGGTRCVYGYFTQPGQ